MPEDNVQPDLRVVIDAWYTPRGVKVNVTCSPPDMYPDTLVDLCERTARFYGKKIAEMGIVAQTVNALEELRIKRSIKP